MNKIIESLKEDFVLWMIITCPSVLWLRYLFEDKWEPSIVFIYVFLWAIVNLVVLLFRKEDE